MNITNALNELWDGMTQAKIAEKLTAHGMVVDQTKVSAWTRVRVPAAQDIATIEKAFGRPRGWVYLKAGYLDLDELREVDAAVATNTQFAVVAAGSPGRPKAKPTKRTVPRPQPPAEHDQ